MRTAVLRLSHPAAVVPHRCAAGLLRLGHLCAYHAIGGQSDGERHRQRPPDRPKRPSQQLTHSDFDSHLFIPPCQTAALPPYLLTENTDDASHRLVFAVDHDGHAMPDTKSLGGNMRCLQPRHHAPSDPKRCRPRVLCFVAKLNPDA